MEGWTREQGDAEESSATSLTLSREALVFYAVMVFHGKTGLAARLEIPGLGGGEPRNRAGLIILIVKSKTINGNLIKDVYMMYF